MHVRRGLLQRLQHPVRDLVVHRVGPLQHEHTARGLEGRARRGGHHRLVDVTDAHDVSPGGPDPGQVRVRARPDPRPRRVGIGLSLREQLGGEGPRGGSLARSGRTVEQVRVRRSARGQRGPEHHPRVRVVLRAVERGRGSVHTAAARAASTRATTSAWTSPGGRSAFTRRTRPGSASASRSYASRTRS